MKTTDRPEVNQSNGERDSVCKECRWAELEHEVCDIAFNVNRIQSDLSESTGELVALERRLLCILGQLSEQVEDQESRSSACCDSDSDI
jgi:hypothetical protein